MELSKVKSRIDEAKGEKKVLFNSIKNTELIILETKERSKSIDKAQAFFQMVAKETQDKLVFHIEHIVQEAIEACWPDTYTFKCEFEPGRGKMEARLFLLQDGKEIDPRDSVGGGLVNITAIALRLAAWSMGKTDNVLIMDEPFTALSVDLQPIAAEIISQITKELGVQIIMVTHNTSMIEKADRIFTVTKNEKTRISKVKEE